MHSELIKLGFLDYMAAVGGGTGSGAAHRARALSPLPNGVKGHRKERCGADGVHPVMVCAVPVSACNRGVLAGG